MDTSRFAKDSGTGFKECYPAGTKVSWHYRSAIGHGTVTGAHKKGTSCATTLYSIRQSDHHTGEPDTVLHYGSALTKE